MVVIPARELWPLPTSSANTPLHTKHTERREAEASSWLVRANHQPPTAFASAGHSWAIPRVSAARCEYFKGRSWRDHRKWETLRANRKSKQNAGRIQGVPAVSHHSVWSSCLRDTQLAHTVATVARKARDARRGTWRQPPVLARPALELLIDAPGISAIRPFREAVPA